MLSQYSDELDTALPPDNKLEHWGGKGALRYANAALYVGNGE